MATRIASIVTRGRVWLNTLLATLKTRPAAALLATGKLRLLKSRVVSIAPDVTLAALAAEEADYTDYPVGGFAFLGNDPVNYNDLGQGYVLQHTFLVTSATPAIGNDIAGYWIDDGTNMVLGEYFGIGADVPMQVQGDYLELNLADEINFLQGL